MKTISVGMTAHLSQEVTTLCTCWKIVRTDGEVFGFTDLDVDLEFDGLVYESETGYNRTAIRSDASLSVDNLDVSGFLESDRISENDLRNGLFDFASVFIFALNWADLTQNEIKLRRGWFGEVVINQNGMFEAEIRGLHQALSHNFMETYQPDCRADFCDDRCKLNIADYTNVGWAFYAETRNQIIVSDGVPTPPPSPSVGAHRFWRVDITALGSNNVGTNAAMAEVRFWDQASHEILGGTATASSQFNGGTTAAKARDLNAATFWNSANGDHLGWWQVDFGTPKDVTRFTIQTRPDAFFYQTPTSWKIQYSADGVSWTDAATYNTADWLTPGETRIFAGFGGPDYSSVPAPSTGATTYIGGTIKFTSGANTGRAMEIVDWDSATGLFTVFDNFPYEIVPGDELELAQGCDKLLATCETYGNTDNFRGEPHVPGQDELLSYPDAHD